MNIKKGDQVKIMAGKDRGKTGTVLRVLRDAGRVSVDGVNMYKKHMKPKRQNQKGEIVSVVRPLAVANVQIVCRSCKKPARMGSRMEGSKKVRYCKRCDAAN